MKKISKIIISVSIIFCVFNNSYAMGQLLGMVVKPKEAADFSLSDLDGNKVSLVDFKGESQLILFFWATWCPHCRNQIGPLNNLNEKLKDKKVKILAIDISESVSKIKAFIKKNPADFLILLDSDAAVSSKYRILGIPTFIIVDLDGSIKFHDHYLPDNIEEILFKK